MAVSYMPPNQTQKYIGLSTDDKPTNPQNGASFLEMDTGEIYFFDKENEMWRVMQ